MNIDDATLLAKLQDTLGNIVDRLSKIAPKEPVDAERADWKRRYENLLADNDAHCKTISDKYLENRRLIANLSKAVAALDAAIVERDAARAAFDEQLDLAMTELDEAKAALAHEQAVAARVVEERDNARDVARRLTELEAWGALAGTLFETVRKWSKP